MKSKGMIFCGYPAIGKSSIAGQSILGPDGEPMPVIDLETTNMRVEGWDRPEQWRQIYVNYAIDLMNQGFAVMCSTHAGVRKELDDRGIEYVNVMPTDNIQNYWLCKLQDRWKKDPSRKNQLAYFRAMEHYLDDVNDMMNNKRYCLINLEGGYDLKHVLDMYICTGKEKWTYN